MPTPSINATHQVKQYRELNLLKLPSNECVTLSLNGTVTVTIN